MITALLIGAGALWLLGRKRNSVSGIGAVRKQKRRIWSEIEQAQRHGIDLTDPDGWKDKVDVLEWMAHGKLSKSNSDKPDEQRYFNQLRRAYKSIAGTNLPYDESVIRNENGDMILTYRDYHLDQLPDKAAEWMYNEAMAMMATDPERAAEKATIALIANGDVKFVWRGDKIHRGLAQEAFAGGGDETERKRRISYLATPTKGGRFIDEFAHALWEHTGMVADDHFIRNGVIDAVLTCDSVGMAREYCLREYLRAHQAEEPLLYQDVPF